MSKLTETNRKIFIRPAKNPSQTGRFLSLLRLKVRGDHKLVDVMYSLQCTSSSVNIAFI